MGNNIFLITVSRFEKSTPEQMPNFIEYLIDNDRLTNKMLFDSIRKCDVNKLDKLANVIKEKADINENNIETYEKMFYYISTKAMVSDHPNYDNYLRKVIDNIPQKILKRDNSIFQHMVRSLSIPSFNEMKKNLPADFKKNSHIREVLYATDARISAHLAKEKLRNGEMTNKQGALSIREFTL
ncbi:MAG: hypothetical protein OIF36_05275 [Alphaproteobacteria bacterium]|nr:hypothetical protein [Alphaproteobacteria bacterium]